MEITHITLEKSNFSFLNHPESMLVKSKSSQQLVKPWINQQKFVKSFSHEPSHFLSFPLRDVQFLKNVEILQDQLLNEHQVHENALVKLHKLHLTCFVLELKDDFQVETAKRILMESQEKIRSILPQKLHVSCRGIDVLKGTIDDARVLYGRIDSIFMKQMLKVVHEIQQEFHSNGLLPNIRKPFFHATLMNTKYQRLNVPIGYNLRNLMQRNSFIELANEMVLETLELCKMSSTANGYETEAIIDLNTSNL